MKAHCSVCNLYFNSNEQFVAHEADELHIRKEKETRSETNAAAAIMDNSVPSENDILLENELVVQTPQIPEQPKLFEHMIENQLAMPDVTVQSISQDVDVNSTDLKEELKHDSNKLVTAEGDEFCNVCLVRLTSKRQADTHFDGSRHKKSVALLIEHTKSLASEVANEDSSASADVVSQTGDQNIHENNEEETHDSPGQNDGSMTEKAKRTESFCEICLNGNSKKETEDSPGQKDDIVAKKKSQKIDFFCEMCLVKLTSTSQIDIHYEGRKHKRAVEILAAHPRSLAHLAANQNSSNAASQNLEDDDHLNNICVVKPTSRSPDDPPCEGSNHVEACAETTVSLNNKTTNQDGTNVTSQSADKDSKENEKKPKDDTPSQSKSKKSKKPKEEEIFCEVCLVKLTSKVQADKHNEGAKHKRALSIIAGPIQPSNPVVGNTCSDVALRNFQQAANRNGSAQRVGYVGQPGASRPKSTKDSECFCSICIVKLTSTLQAVMHYEGRQHKKAAAVVAGNSDKRFSEGTKKKEVIVCEVCHVSLSSQVVADAHYAGSKHAKKLELFLSKQNGGLGFERGHPDTESVCDICIVALSSKVAADAHYAGAKHMRKLKMLQSIRGNASENPSGGDNQAMALVINSASSQVTQSSSIAFMPVPGGSVDEQRKALVGNFFSCDICDIKVNSQHQMESHWQASD